MNVVLVKYDYSNTSEYFSNNKFNLKKNLTVIVDTAKGYQFGKVVQIIDDISSFDGVDLGQVIRVSTKKDYLHYLENVKMAKDALLKCKDIVSDFNLNMNILDSCYNFDRSQLLFRFIADERVFEEIPVKKEVKATVSGLYITGVRGLRGPLEKPQGKQKKGLRAKLQSQYDKANKKLQEEKQKK